MILMRLSILCVCSVLVLGCGVANHAVNSPNASSDESLNGDINKSSSTTLTPKDKEQLEIEDLVKANLADIRRCYEHALDETPSLKGVMTVDFEIDESGNVHNERSSGLDHKALEQCVLGKFSSLEFPSTLAVKDKLAVSYPLVFNR